MASKTGVFGSFVRIDEGNGETTTWPHPGDPSEVQWRLRYGEPSREDLLIAASFMHAYGWLLTSISEARYREVRRKIRKTLETSGRSTT